MGSGRESWPPMWSSTVRMCAPTVSPRPACPTRHPHTRHRILRHLSRARVTGKQTGGFATPEVPLPRSQPACSTSALREAVRGARSSAVPACFDVGWLASQDAAKRGDCHSAPPLPSTVSRYNAATSMEFAVPTTKARTPKGRRPLLPSIVEALPYVCLSLDGVQGLRSPECQCRSRRVARRDLCRARASSSYSSFGRRSAWEGGTHGVADPERRPATPVSDRGRPGRSRSWSRLDRPAAAG
jgi:hypothetical protein